MRKLLLGMFFVLAVAGSAFAASADGSIFQGYSEVIMTKLPFTPAAGQTVVLAAGAADTAQIDSIDIFVDGKSIAVCETSNGKFGQCLKSAGPWYDVGKPHSYYATATTSSGRVLYSKIYDFVLQPAASAQYGIAVGAFQEETAYCNVCISKGAGYDKSKQECEKGTALGSTESGGATLSSGNWVFYSTDYQKNQIAASNAQLKGSLSCEGLASKASVTSTSSGSQTGNVNSCKYQCSTYKYSEGQCFQGWQCVSGCLTQNNCVNTTSVKSTYNSTTVTKSNATASNSTAGSCKFSCSTYKYTEGLCYQGWQCISGCLTQNSCVNTTSVKSVSNSTNVSRTTTASNSAASSCKFSCSVYNYTEGLCNQGWQCSNGCIKYNSCVNSTKASVSTTSTSAGSCKFSCPDYKYTEGQCYQGWQCVSGCVIQNSCQSSLNSTSSQNYKISLTSNSESYIVGQRVTITGIVTSESGPVYGVPVNVTQVLPNGVTIPWNYYTTDHSGKFNLVIYIPSLNYPFSPGMWKFTANYGGTSSDKSFQVLPEGTQNA